MIDPAYNPDLILFENNDNAHGTRGFRYNVVRQMKDALGIRNIPNKANSPDLNPVERVIRTVKQRCKSFQDDFRRFRSPELDELVAAEWCNVEQKDIRKYIKDLLNRVREVCKRKGHMLVDSP